MTAADKRAILDLHVQHRVSVDELSHYFQVKPMDIRVVLWGYNVRELSSVACW